MKISIRNLLLLVLTIAVAFTLTRQYLRLTEYARNFRRGERYIDSLHDHQPKNISVEGWEHATNWIGVAYANIFFSPEHASLEQLKAFIEYAERETSRPVTTGTTDRLWRRMAETGPHGKQYIAKFDSQYRIAFTQRTPVARPNQPARTNGE